MNDNQKKTPNNNRNKKNLSGLLILLAWAVVLTVVFNYLSAYLTEVAGLPQTGYQQYLKDLWQELPIVNTVGYVDGEGNWVHTSDEENLSPTAQTALDEYKRVLYNNIFDKGRRPSDFFTLASP